MIESVLAGAGSKLIFTLVTSWFHNSEKKSERKYLTEKHMVEAHIELAKINANNPLMNATQSLLAVMAMGAWCFIGIYAMRHPTETDVLIPITTGWLMGMFNQPEAIIAAGRTPGVLFQAWFEVMIALITMYSLPVKRG